MRFVRWLAFLVLLVPGPIAAAISDSSFVLETDSSSYTKPTFIGNGSFSLSSTPFALTPADSYMAAVYDEGPGDVPRIALLPAWNHVDVFNGVSWLSRLATKEGTTNLPSFHQRLDMYRGALQTAYEWRDGDRTIALAVDAFISRSDPAIAAISIRLKPNFSGPIGLKFPLEGRSPPHRLELAKLEKIEPGPDGKQPQLWYPGHMIVQDRGSEADQHHGKAWLTAATEGRGTQVSLAAEIDWPRDLKNVSAHAEKAEDIATVEIRFDAQSDKEYVFHKYVAVVSQRTPKFKETALEATASAKKRGYDSLFQTHTQAWQHLWETDIQIEGNPELQKIVHAMMFYILSSIRENSDFSIPPMGLSSAGYYGHIFWDADTWMFPPWLVMHPEIARSMVMFRSKTLDAAKKKAQFYGYKGAMYPWEADEIGNETTPQFAYQNAKHEIHVTGDVALAQWQYYLATKDKDWLKTYGYPVIRETANFWVSRTTFNQEKNRYEIQKTVSVDEGLIGINNDTYTNSIAKKNLEIANAAAAELGEKADPAWAKIQKKIYIPYDAEKEYHPTYEDAPPEKLGSVVALLSYPLEVPMSERAKKNNLELAVREMEQHGRGAMMSITLYSVLAVETKNSELLDKLFTQSYDGYLRPPFYALSETPTNDATNFLTGAGGFLQQLIFGFTGLRFSTNGWTEKFDPMLPSQIKKLTLKNFVMRNKKYDVVIEGNRRQIISR